MARKCGRTFFAVRGETSPSSPPILPVAPNAVFPTARVAASSRAFRPPATMAAAPAIVALGVGVSGPSRNASRPAGAPCRRERAGAGLALPAPSAPDSSDNRTDRRSGSEAAPFLLRAELPPLLLESGAWLRVVLPLLVSPRAVRPVVSRPSATLCGQVSGRVLLARSEPARAPAGPPFFFASRAIKIRRTSLSYLSCERQA